MQHLNLIWNERGCSISKHTCNTLPVSLSIPPSQLQSRRHLLEYQQMSHEKKLCMSRTIIVRNLFGGKMIRSDGQGFSAIDDCFLS